MKSQKFKVYEYPLIDVRGHIYYGSYTIKESAKPCGFKNEQLVDTFEAVVKE